MFANYRSFYLYLVGFLITFLSSSAQFCSELTSTEAKDTPCFMGAPTHQPVVLRSAGSSLVLPCHVARSKGAAVEWWYTDAENTTNIKIYPAYPPVRPTVLRFVTSSTPVSKTSNEVDILDASILLRHVNVDDSGMYRCVIRPSSIDGLEQDDTIPSVADWNAVSLRYQLQLTAPRLCQSAPSVLPCFTAMRTTSPTVLDAYKTTFLQCVVKNYNRPVNVFWVVGNSSINSVLVTNHLTTNQYNGDRLKRVFPLSASDYSIELSVNQTIPERTYSCVINGATDRETTLFTYIVRAIDVVQPRVESLPTSTSSQDPSDVTEANTLEEEKPDSNNDTEEETEKTTTDDE